MPDLESAIAAQRKAADAFKAAALRVSEAVWNVPRARGKWSPAQVTDHVGVSTKVSRSALGENSGMGSIPRFLRPLLRKFAFDPVIRKGVFPKKGKAPSIFAPAHDPLPREQLLARIDAEIDAATVDARALAKAGKLTFDHGYFGRVSLADYVMFNALHFDHHREQLP